MTRREFPVAVRRAALKRAAGHCEAVGGPYSLPTGKRCNAPLGHGVEFDHIIADAIGGQPTLENCAAVCIPCHRIKSQKHDTPRAAKTKRQADKHSGVVRPKQRIKSRGFPHKPKPPKLPLPEPRGLFTT